MYSGRYSSENEYSNNHNLKKGNKDKKELKQDNYINNKGFCAKCQIF